MEYYQIPYIAAVSQICNKSFLFSSRLLKTGLMDTVGRNMPDAGCYLAAGAESCCHLIMRELKLHSVETLAEFHETCDDMCS